MKAIQTGTRLTLKNILFLTDFSEPSDIAIPYVIAIAREYEAKVFALHVLTPVPLAFATPESTASVIEGFEEGAQAEMQRLDSQLVGVSHRRSSFEASPFGHPSRKYCVIVRLSW